MVHVNMGIPSDESYVFVSNGGQTLIARLPNLKPCRHEFPIRLFSKTRRFAADHVLTIPFQ